MKKLILILSLCFLTFFTFAQSNVNNPGFETWDNLGAANEEPAEWNSFKTGSGFYANFAQQQIKRSTKVRSGAPGSYSALIWSMSILGTIANGCVTTGQVNMGATAPSSSSNYNITHTSNSSFSEAFSASPDSLVFWICYKPVNSGSNARVHAIMHDTYDVRDPIDAGSLPHVRAEATLNFPTTSNSWIRKSIPYIYNGAAATSGYILITFTANNSPGGGNAGDSLYIDDIEMIYNVNLSSLTVSQGTLVPAFAPNTTDYSVTLPFGSTVTPTVNASTESSHATFVVTPAADITSASVADRTTTVVVTGGDGTTTKTYSVVFGVSLSDDASLSYLSPAQGILSPAFNSDTLHYTAMLPHGTTMPPTVTATPNNPGSGVAITDATDITSATPADRTTTIHVTAPDGITTRDYSILFDVNPYNNDASLSSLTMNSIPVSSFHPDTLTYNFTLPHAYHGIPLIDGTPHDVHASKNVVQATLLPGTATLTVTAEDGITTRTYRVNFFLAPPLTDASLRDLRVNDTTIAGFSAAVFLYDYYVPLGTVTVPNVTATPHDTNAYLVITQASAIPGQAEINVYAEDSTTIQTYIVNIFFTNGIKDNEANSTRVFPNPATDYLTIDAGNMTGKVRFILTDVHGRNVSDTFTDNASCTVDIRDLPSGLYFYRVYSEKKICARGNIQICR